MYESVDIIFSNGFSNALCALDVHIFKGKVSEQRLVQHFMRRLRILCRIIPSDKIVHDI